MDRLLELLAQILTLSADERAELDALIAEHLTPGDDNRFPDLTDDQVEAYMAAVRTAAHEVAQSDSPDVELLTVLVESHEAVETEASTRVEEAEAQAATVADLLSRVAANDNGDSDADDEDGDDDGEDDSADSVDQTEPAAVTAATRPSRRAPLGRVAARQQTRTQTAPETDDDNTGRRILAGANLTGFASGAQVQDLDRLAETAAEVIRRTASANQSRLHLARFVNEYPEERQLSSSDARLNMQRVDQVHQSALAARRAGATDARFEALVAAGGLCAPLPVRYDQDVIGDTDRPVVGALGGFDASRGGVRYVPGPTLSDIGVGGSPGDTNAAIGTWTMDNDEAADPDDSATFKTIQRIDCGEEATATLYMITARLQVGNIQAMTWPERVAAIIRLASIAYARSAEQAALARIEALSTTVAGFGGPLSAARDFIAEVATAAHSLRVQNRVARTYPVRVIAPEALYTAIIIDLARQMPGDQSMGRAAQILADSLAQIGVVVTWSPDMVIPTLESGALAPIPTALDYAVFLEGTFDFADGLNIDLGFESNTPIRDSRLNAVNDYELFMEGAEQVVKFGGHQALWVESTLCPSGTSSGTADVECAS